MYKILFFIFFIFFSSQIIAQPAVTEEVQIQGVYLKVQSGSTAIALGITTVNNTSGGFLKVLGTFTADEHIVNAYNYQVF